MPTLTPLKRNWGKVDKAALLQLIVDGKVDIEDHSHENIDAVHERWFSTHLKRNFRRNFKDYAASFDLERALAGARRQEARGKIRVCVFFTVDCCLIIAFNSPAPLFVRRPLNRRPPIV